MRAWIAAALVACLSAGGASAQINSGDPASVAQALTSMGYKPGAVTMMDGTPVIRVALADFETAIGFSDCVDGKQCKFLFLMSSFTDVKDPPKEWVNKRNNELDVGKVWVNEDLTTMFSIAVPTGGEQMTVAAMRYVIDSWQNVIAYLSQSAMSEKLVE